MKLGLALSGGGFRASLFHIGVMARLAELDLLGKVEVLSTVSGGSIIGAMYYLMLKDLLETPAAPPPAPSAPAPLSQADFVALVGRLETRFLAGVQHNPDTHVVTDPIQNIRMALTDYSRTERMGALYNRYFFREVWEQCTGLNASSIPLRDIKITPPWCPPRETYNASHPYKIPMLIINATTLNTGNNWRFTASEVGDPDLGFIRFDEVFDIVALRRWLADRTQPLPRRFQPETAQLAAGVSAGSLAQGGPIGNALLALGGGGLAALALRDLYALHNLAWGAASGPTAGRSVAAAQLDERLRRRGLDPATLRSVLAKFGLTCEALFSLLHLAGMAGRVTDTCDRDMEKLTLEEAVGASAAVPGLFQPLVFRDLYDDRTVEAVRLVDGGVYDNQGLTALFEEGCTHVICSDASGQLRFERDVSDKVFGVIPRANEVLMEKIRRSEVRRLLDQFEASTDLKALHLGRQVLPPPDPTQEQAEAIRSLRERFSLEGCAFFHLKSEIPPVSGGMPALPWRKEVSEIRTDLDSFSDREAFALMYHGYYLAAKTVAPPAFPAAGMPAVPETPDRWRFGAIRSLFGGPDLRRHLAVGANRTFRVLRLGNAWSGLAWLLAGAMFLAGWAWIPSVTLNEILVWPLTLFQIREPITVGFFVPFPGKLAAVLPELKPILEFSILPVGDLFDLPFHLPFLALVASAAFVALSLWGRFKALLLRKNLEGLWLLFSFVSKYKRLPLAPLAVVWSVIAAALAWTYHLTFDKLFLKAGRL
jgi:predicted acylesterase/phospholipase RssA